MTKIWMAMFWGDPYPDVAEGRVGVLRHHPLMSSTTALVIVGTVAVALVAGPLFDYCTGAAAQLIDPGIYRAAVLGS